MSGGEVGEGDYVAGNPALGGSAALVVISGCSGGGKSALLAELARRGHATMPEPGRQIVKEQLHIGGHALPWRDVAAFVDLCLSRAMHFFNSARPGAVTFFDRSIVDAVTGLRREGLPVPGSMERALEGYRYGPVVFLAPPWPELFAGDAERRHPFGEAVAEYEALAESYPALGYEVVTIPKAGIAERADFLEARLGLRRAGSAIS